MTRKMVVLGTIAAFGLSAALVGAGDAFACDKSTKTASAKAASTKVASTGSCTKDAAQASAVSASACTKDAAAATTTASASCCAKATKTTTAGDVHKAMIKSAMVAPGASPIINTAAFAANLQGSTVSVEDCCKSANASAAMAGGSCDKGAAVHTAGAGKSCGSAAQTAGAEGCDKSTKTAAAVDVVPYRENKRLVLTGSYECGHCGIGATAECSPMFKTADGKVYPLWNSERVSNLREAETAKNVEISTVVKKVDGVKYLDVKSYKSL